MKKVAFLDRDGVINQDKGYVSRIDDFIFVDGCFEALKQLGSQYDIIIVTNQSGIGRGYYTEADYSVLTRWYLDVLASKQIHVKDVFHCPHSPEENCDCRKPKAGLFWQAAEKYPIDFQGSLMIGDKLSDMAAAEAAGIKQLYLVASNYHCDQNDHGYLMYQDILQVAKQVTGS